VGLAAIGTNIASQSLYVDIRDGMPLAEATELTRLSVSTLRRHAKAGTIGARMFNGRWMTTETEVHEFMYARAHRRAALRERREK
jgi:predicted site-specific integrase-resolvase